ncbi:MAG TPA: glycosyltransferase family 9 protein [Bryobacteraceae bacterium]|nr:glycosyltransferase family 9 protein [Bryobacteraceae bacterium]
MQPDPSVRKVLIYRIGSLGDTVVALPSFHLIARSFPRAERWMLTNFPVHAKAPASASVLGESGLVHGYMRYTVGTRNPTELLRLSWRIRRFNPDVLVYLTPARGEQAVRRDALFFQFSGVRRIVGLPEGELASSRFDPATGLWEREAARLLRCIDSLGMMDLSDLASWDLRLTNAETRRADRMLAPVGGAPLIACGPGTKMQAKEWGRERWRELLAKLSRELPGHALVLVGAKEDAEVSEYAAGSWKGSVVNLCGQLTPRESAAVLRCAKLFLGADSGPMHLAAAYGVSCVIPFAALDLPGRWYPIGVQHRSIYHQVECAGCRLTTCIEKKKVCIESITVGEVFQAAMQVICREEIAS